MNTAEDYERFNESWIKLLYKLKNKGVYNGRSITSLHSRCNKCSVEYTTIPNSKEEQKINEEQNYKSVNCLDRDWETSN